MTDRLNVDEMRRRELVKRTRRLVWAESIVVLGLLIWVSIEYENNLFLQPWANAWAMPLVSACNILSDM